MTTETQKDVALDPYSGLPPFLQEKLREAHEMTQETGTVGVGVSVTRIVDTGVETTASRLRPSKPKRKPMFPETRKALKNLGWWRIVEIIFGVGLVYYGIAAAPEAYNWLVALVFGCFWIILLMLGTIRDKVNKLCRKRKRQPSMPKTSEPSAESSVAADSSSTT